LLKETAAKRKVSIRILISLAHDPSDRIQQKKQVIQIKDTKTKQFNKLPIEIRFTKKRMQSKLVVLVIDNALSLEIDLKKDTIENDDDDSIGLATYTNSEARIETFSSMFEIFWLQSRELKNYEDGDNSRSQSVNNKHELIE
jgi:archaellin